MAKRRDPMKVALVVSALLIWAAAVYFAVEGPRGLFGSDPPTQPTAETKPSGSASSSSRTQPAASQTASGATSSSSGAAAAPAGAGDTSACVAALFPEHTFKAKPDMEFVCSEANALRGATEVKSQVVLGSSGGVSQGMRVWAGLGWYHMAAYSLLRTHCCAAPPKLKWSFDLVCPIDERLAELEIALRAKNVDEMDAVLERYAKEVICLSKFGQANNFGQSSPAGAGVVALRKLLEAAGLSKK